MRKCKDCNKTKNIKEFYRINKIYCKECHKKRVALWRKNNPYHKEKQAKYYREWYASRGRKRSRQGRELVNLWQKLNPEKCRTYHLVLYAVKVGKIKKPKDCSKCGLERKLIAHHDDYEFPLRVKWLCYSCHKKKHNPT